MSQISAAAQQSHLQEFFDQVEFLNEATIFIWLGGTLFTRLATGVWLGGRPAVVLITVLTLVYLYMHRGRYHTMLIRFPLVLLLLFLGQTYIIHSGSFLAAQPFVLSWKQLMLAWIALNFSFLFQGDEYLSGLTSQKTSAFTTFTSYGKHRSFGKIIPLGKAQRTASR